MIGKKKKRKLNATQNWLQNKMSNGWEVTRQNNLFKLEMFIINRGKHCIFKLKTFKVKAKPS